MTVNWERDDAYWDTHANNFESLKDKPPAATCDRAMSALLEDLDERGLLDETLVVWLAEFGRTPKINGVRGPRPLGPVQLASCSPARGSRAGPWSGASDRLAAYPVPRPGHARGPGRDDLPPARDRARHHAPRGRRPAPDPLPRDARSPVV